jgi:hypothetical protein
LHCILWRNKNTHTTSLCMFVRHTIDWSESFL